VRLAAVGARRRRQCKREEHDDGSRSPKTHPALVVGGIRRALDRPLDA
jgi:hypothetical protein